MGTKNPYMASNVLYSTTERNITSVPPPLKTKLTIAQLFDRKTNKPNVRLLKSHFLQEGRLEISAAIQILELTSIILRSEKNILEIEEPVAVCGDIHGQFYDLMRLFEVGGPVQKIKYLFLGDYIDRGSFSIECVLYLYALKFNYPKSIFLLRGNHECRLLSTYFSFRYECEVKYSERVYQACMSSFDFLPIAALLEQKYLCVHGGLSPEVHTLNDINGIYRARDTPSHGPLCDLLWADPTSDFGSENRHDFFTHNAIRGCSFSFSYAACCDFINQNGLLTIIRAHEVQPEGFQMYKNNKTTGFPALITIFSAPNYLDVYKNKAAILIMHNNVFNIKQFLHSPHPYWLPNFMDAFTWSLPQIVNTMTRGITAIMNVCTKEELYGGQLLDPQYVQTLKKRSSLIRRARHSISAMHRVSNSVLVLKGLTPSGNIPTAMLKNEQKATLTAAAHGFSDKAEYSYEQVKSFDSINEYFPPMIDQSPDINVKRKSSNVVPPRKNSKVLSSLRSSIEYDPPITENQSPDVIAKKKLSNTLPPRKFSKRLQSPKGSTEYDPPITDNQSPDVIARKKYSNIVVPPRKISKMFQSPKNSKEYNPPIIGKQSPDVSAKKKLSNIVPPRKIVKRLQPQRVPQTTDAANKTYNMK